MEHIPTKLHPFLISSFRDYPQTDRRADTHTDAAKSNTCSQHSRRAFNNLSTHLPDGASGIYHIAIAIGCGLRQTTVASC